MLGHTGSHGRSMVARVRSTAVEIVQFDRSVWGYGLNLFGSVTDFPWPLGPSLFTSYSGHLAAGIDAVATTIDVTGDEPLLGGLILPPAPPADVVLEIESESVLLTDTGTGPDDWTVARGLLGTAVPHASGSAVTIDDHGTGSVVAGAVTYTQPIAGTFVVAWGAYITDNVLGDHITGTWTFELRVNGSPVDTATCDPAGGEVNSGWFTADVPAVELNIGDKLTIVATGGTNPSSLDEVSWAYIRVYGNLP